MTEAIIKIRATDATKRAFSSVSKGLGKIRAGANSAQVKIGILAGVAGFGALIRASSKTADSLAKTADKIGISTEALAGLQNAAEITGVSQETLNKALVKQQVAISDYSNGIGLAKREFEQLGFAQDELAKLSADEQFIAISEALSKVKNSTDRVNIAYKIYGGRATDLLNTLDLGADGLRKFREESDALGTSLGRINAAKIEASNDAFARIGQATKGFGLQLTAKVAPILEVIANRFVNIAKEAGGMGNVAGTILNSLVTGAGYVANAFRGLEIVWQGLRVALAGMVSFVLDKLNNIQQAIFGIINKIPGVDIKPFQGLENAAAAIGNVSVDAQAKLLTLMTQPLPSENFKKWSVDVQAETKATAIKVSEVISAAGGGNVGSVDLGAIEAEKDNDRIAKRLARLDESLLTEKERLRLGFEDKQFIIEEAFQQGLLLDSERKNRLLTVESEFEENLSQIMKNGATERQEFLNSSAKQQTKTVVGELILMTQGVSRQNKTLFKINKVSGIANAIINTHEGVSKTLAKYPQPLAGILAAGHLAAGLAQVNAIRSASFSGGASVRSVGGGSTGVPPSSEGLGINNVVGTKSVEEESGSKGTVNIVINTGGLVDDEGLVRLVNDKIVPIIRDGIDSNDVILISSSSRNAQEIINI